MTGTRAEYGLLKPLITKIDKEDELQLLLYVTGMHLSSEFGYTYQEIVNDGIVVHRKIEMLLSSDTSSGILKSMGVEILGLADALSEDLPDLMILLGDRYEILIAATAAMIYRIPIAHIHGGEVTEGAIDDAIRHAVTKMSYLHFTSSEAYRRRIIQLGEEPDRVYNVGALGVENSKKLKLLTKEELEKQLNFKFENMIAIVTFHPATLENTTAERQIEIVLEALKQFPRLKFIFTKSNADMDGEKINRNIANFVSEHRDNCVFFDSLGQLRYLSALKYSNIIIGNSSSGIIEAPSFGVATVNIGNRQKGRIRAKSVIDCELNVDNIVFAIKKGLSKEFSRMIQGEENPYEGIGTSDNIISIIKTYLKCGIKLQKKFYDINGEWYE